MDVSAFADTVRGALALAGEALVTFGVAPTGPETGYGYIRPGAPFGPGFWAREFKEKPDLETARQYVRDGYFWNSGMFLFDSALFRREVAQHALEAVFAAFDGAAPGPAFAVTPAISIDYGVLEHSAHVAVVPLQSDWSDLGSFLFYDAYAPRADEQGNICADAAVLLDAADNLVYTDAAKTVALVGVDSLWWWTNRTPC